jgi:hypothetical protein
MPFNGILGVNRTIYNDKKVVGVFVVRFFVRRFKESYNLLQHKARLVTYATEARLVAL